ncbi:hypothetical protein [Micromonospora mirobrigensis]|uniref:Uncharacterized protein n=1 Tax=Micromonospora mirobrigensis TaxID=262898 RepID=A0A1C4US29_9ACTN|nr:hypothetical protein [Micromonospora mirobrigensis]SCE74523.1 hypothetical protein GA0070564_101681 [Micromonospora mirobrigensis]
MGDLVQRVITDLREIGYPLHEAGTGWFAVSPTGPGEPEVFLHLVDDEVERYLAAMSAEDVDGAFGPEVTLADARYRLTLLHLEEQLDGRNAGTRYVVLDGGEIRAFESVSHEWWDRPVVSGPGPG